MPDNHTWTVRSRHLTSEGTVTYLHCACGQYLVRTDRAADGLVVGRPDPAPTVLAG